MTCACVCGRLCDCVPTCDLRCCRATRAAHSEQRAAGLARCGPQALPRTRPCPASRECVLGAPSAFARTVAISAVHAPRSDQGLSAGLGRFDDLFRHSCSSPRGRTQQPQPQPQPRARDVEGLSLWSSQTGTDTTTRSLASFCGHLLSGVCAAGPGARRAQHSRSGSIAHPDSAVTARAPVKQEPDAPCLLLRC